MYSQENSELVGCVPLDLDISYLKLNELLYSSKLLFPIYQIGMIRLSALQVCCENLGMILHQGTKYVQIMVLRTIFKHTYYDHLGKQ